MAPSPVTAHLHHYLYLFLLVVWVQSQTDDWGNPPIQSSEVHICTQTHVDNCHGRKTIIDFIHNVPIFGNLCGPSTKQYSLTDMQVVDWNGDGYVDVVLRDNDGPFRLFKNINGTLVEMVGSDSPFYGIMPPSINISSTDIWREHCANDTTINDPAYEFFHSYWPDRCSSSTPPGFVLADWDNDGDNDLLVGDDAEPGSHVHFYRCNESGILVEELGAGHPFANLSFGRPPTVLARRLQAVDWDKDGDLDLIVVEVDVGIAGFSNHISWVTSNFKTNFTGAPTQNSRARYFERLGTSGDGPLVELTGEDNPFHTVNLGTLAQLVAADWDGDGDDDVIVARTHPPGLWEGFEGEQEYTQESWLLTSIQYLDRNAAGHLTHIGVGLTSFEQHPFGWYAGPNAFRHKDRFYNSSFLNRYATPFVHAIDWDGGALLDLLLFDCNDFDMLNRSAHNSLVDRHSNNNPLAAVPVLLQSNPQVVDMDGDGRLDLISTSLWEPSRPPPAGMNHTVSYFAGTESGSFRPVELESSPLRGIFTGNSMVTDLSLFEAIFAVDWDGDNDMDLLVRKPSSEVVLHKAVDGELETIGTPIGLSLGRPGRGINNFEAVDWNGDGRLDILAMPNYTFSPFTQEVFGSTVEFWAQTESGTFVRRCVDDVTAMPTGFECLTCGDPCVFMAGSFHVVDWNRDGDLDILVSMPNNWVYVLERWEGRTALNGRMEPQLHPLVNRQVSGFGKVRQSLWAFFNEPHMSLILGSGAVPDDGALYMDMFTEGWCVPVTACNRAGVCTAAGKCKCVNNHTLSDCSGCQKDFYTSRQDRMGNVYQCVPCPVGDNNYNSTTTCSERGVCDDDHAAKSAARARGSYTGEANARGSGTCKCRTNFWGPMCEGGTCPPGMELQLLDSGVRECRTCPAGRAKDEASLEECKECTAGRWANATGQCQPCAAGRYSVKTGSAAACQLCDFGRWNPEVGSDDPDKCRACPDGTTTEQQGESEERCIRPAEGQVVTDCVAGQHCEVRLGGKLSSFAPHQLAVHKSCSGTVVTGIPNEGVSGVAEENGTLYRWSDIFRSNGGNYSLCWCSGMQDFSCSLPRAFEVAVGHLILKGPYAVAEGVLVAVRSRSQTNLGPIVGHELQPSDRLRIAGKCEASPIDVEGVKEADVEFLDGEPTALIAKFAQILSPPGSYWLCWSRANGTGFDVPVGPLILEGPGSQSHSCDVGQHCTIRNFTGTNLKAGDQLMLSLDCDAGLKGVPLSTAGEDGVTFEFGGSGEPLDIRTGIYVLCWRRPPYELWVSTGYLTAAGPFGFGALEETCELGSRCILQDVPGMLLNATGDLLLVLDGECDSGTGQRLGSLGFPGWQEPSMAENGTASSLLFDLGQLPSNATPGRYDLCWCPGGRGTCRNTTDFRASAGRLSVTCPKGQYSLSSLGRPRCVICARGSYCEGGLPASAVRVSCPGGSTTVAPGASNSDACVCRRGYQKLADDCDLCPSNYYKDTISDDELCKPCPADGITFGLGATTAASCLVPALANRSSEQQNVSAWTVTVDISIEGLAQSVLVGSDWPNLRDELREATAHSGGIHVAQVQIEQGGSERRAQAIFSQKDAQRFNIMVNVRNWPEAQEVARDLNTNTFVEEIAATASAGSVELLSVPSVDAATITCAGDGEKSPPPGVPILSPQECVCSPGYYYETSSDTCNLCTVGWYKESSGNTPCVSCPRVEGEDGFTNSSGSDSWRSCLCSPGWFGQIVLSDKLELAPNCQPCGEGSFCPGGPSRLSCPANSTTPQGAANTKDVKGCWCEAGYGLSASNGSTSCKPCDAGRYKENTADQPCEQQCTFGATSVRGATNSTDCYCMDGRYLNTRTNGCEQCPSTGVTCHGGFLSNSSTHREPESEFGFYMVALDSAVECTVKAGNSKGELLSVCLGGASRSLTRDRENRQASEGVCKEGHMGLVCGACAAGYARDENDVECEACEEAGEDWQLVACMMADCIFQVAYAAFVTQLTISNAEDSKSLDSIFIRLFTQWMSVMAVLANFDYSAVPILDWSQRFTTAETTTIFAQFTLKWPPFFHEVASVMFKFNGYIPSVVPPQQALQCVLLRQGFSRRTAEDASSLYWFLYPITNGIWMVVLMLFAAKVIHPGLTWLRTQQKLQKTLTKAWRLLGIPQQLAEEMVSLMCEDELQAALQSPREYLQDIDHLWSTFGEQLTRQMVAARLLRQCKVKFRPEEVQNICLMCDKTALGLAAKNPRRAGQEIKKQKGTWALAWAKASVLADLQALKVEESHNSASALSTVQRSLACVELGLTADEESSMDKSELHARALGGLDVSGLVALHRLALLHGGAPPSVLAALHSAQGSSQACLDRVRVLRTAAPAALGGDVDALLQEIIHCGDSVLRRLGAEVALRKTGCPADLARVAAGWLAREREGEEEEPRARELQRLRKQGSEQLCCEEDLPTALAAGPLLAQRLLQLGCGQGLAARAAAALAERCSKDLLPSLALVLGSRCGVQAAGGNCCTLRAFDKILDVLDLGPPCQVLYGPALRCRMVQAGSPPATSDAAQEALTESVLSNVEQDLEGFLFGDARAALQCLSSVLQGLDLGSNFRGEFLPVAVSGRLENLGVSIKAANLVRESLRAQSRDAAWPQLSQLLFATPTLELLTSVVSSLGVEDTHSAVAQSLLQRRLISLGAHEFHAGRAASHLTVEVYKCTKSSLQELIFGGEGRRIELLLEVYGELFPDSAGDARAQVTEDILKPALSARVLGLGGSRVLASRMSAGLTCHLVGELLPLLEQVLYNRDDFGLELLEALVIRLGASTFEECLSAFAKTQFGHLGLPLTVAISAATQAVTQALHDPGGRLLLDHALLPHPRALVCGQRLAALQDLLGTFTSLKNLHASVIQPAFKSWLSALRPCVVTAAVHGSSARRAQEQEALAAQLASELSESRAQLVLPELERLLLLPIEQQEEDGRGVAVAGGRGIDALVGVCGLENKLRELLGGILRLDLDDSHSFESLQLVLSSLEILLFDGLGSPTAALVQVCQILEADALHAGLQPALERRCLRLGLAEATAFDISKALAQEHMEKATLPLDRLLNRKPQVGLLEALRSLLDILPIINDGEAILLRLFCRHVGQHRLDPRRFRPLKHHCEESNGFLTELEPVMEGLLRGKSDGILTAVAGLCDLAGLQPILFDTLLPTVLRERLQQLKASEEVLAHCSTVIKQMQARGLQSALASLLFGADGALEVLRDLKDIFVLEDVEEELVVPGLSAWLQKLGVPEGEIEEAVARLSHLGIAEELPNLEQLLLGSAQGWREAAGLLHRIGIDPACYTIPLPDEEAADVWDPSSDSSLQNPGLAHGELQELVVLGLFTDASLRSVCLQCIPIFTVMLYNIWMPISIRLLAALACETFVLEAGDDFGELKPQMRWLGNTTQECIPSMSARALLAIAGLVIWSVGFLIVLYSLIRRHKEELAKPAISRRYGYFYMGFQPKHWWWELGVKRTDTLVVMVITYTSIIQNPHTKLIGYMVVAGVCWAAHNTCRPFDDRENSVLNRFEGACLRTRFLTFSVIVTLLLSAELMHEWLVVTLAIALLIVNGYFLLCFFLAIGSALFDNVNVLAPFMKKHGGAGGLDKTAMLKRIITTISRIALRKALRVLLRVVTWGFRIINGEKDDMKEQAPRFLWQGTGMPLKVVDCRRSALESITCCGLFKTLPLRVLQLFISSFYGLGHLEQKTFMATSLGKVYNHLLTHAHFQQLPVSVDALCLITLALMRIEKANSDEGYRRLSVEEAMVDVLEKADERLRTRESGEMNRDTTRRILTPAFTGESGADSLVELEWELCFSAEDLNTTVMHLHNLDQEHTKRLFEIACDEVLRRHTLNRQITRLDVKLSRLSRRPQSATRAKASL